MLRLKSSGYTFDQNMHVLREPADQLNALLRIELAAITSYKNLIPHVKDLHFKAVVQHCYDLHVQSSEKLAAQIRVLQARSATQADVWQSITAVVANVATIFGDQAVKAALEKSELTRLEAYEYELTCLDGENLRLVQQELAPIQQSICACLSGTKL